MNGYKEVNMMILRLAGPYAVAKAFSEFFGYKFFQII